MPKGGKREGAGRPAAAEPMRRVTLSLPASLLDELDKLAYSGSNRSETVTRLLKAALRKPRKKSS